MTADDIKTLVSIATLAMAIGSVVWNGGKLAGVVRQLAELVAEHEKRLDALEAKRVARKKKS
jgi:cell division protein FtsB